MPALDVVVGRQPIFDRDRSVFGYELLFRTLGGPTAAESAGSLGDQMTADVIFNSVSIGLDRLVGDKTLFCNASRGVLTGVVPILLPPRQTVVEIVETVVAHEEVLAGCARLRDEGFTLALDDVTSLADIERFADLVSIVKIDLRDTEPADLPHLVEHCRRLDVALVAEKVETTDEFNHCEALGFDYFQGYLLARPSEVAGRALDPGRVAQLRLAAHLLDRECPMAELEDIVRRDPAMTLQLLQLAGMGAAGGMRRTVQTVREALVLVGWRRLQSWVSLLLIGGKGQASDEELTTALTRARTCELVAETVDRSLSATAFTAGLLASFDVLLGVPLEDILRDLPLDDGLRRAILDAEGTLGRLVADVADFQVGRSEDAVRSGFEDSTLSSAALKGLMWAVEMTSTLAVAS
ncbi:MAG TPA: EAL domain-containing protein [Acidimicrobiales bacterium]|nr:EAL domain-containing protein [Acidimicrobiales bacterium]